MSVQNDKIEPHISEIKQNIDRMNQKISDIESTACENERYAIAATVIMHEYSVKAGNMRIIENLLMDCVKDYSEIALFEIKKSVDEKIQTIIRDTKLKLLDIKKKELRERKISWFGKLRGLGKLRDIELANIELEEQILRNSGIKSKGEYSILDSLADMRAFSIRELDGQNTEEMQSLFAASNEVFQIQDNVVEDRARRKLNAVPMVIVDPKRRVRISQKITNAEKRNANLKAEFVDVYNSYGVNQNFSRYSNIDVLEQFYSLLDEAARSTRIDEPEKAQDLDKINANVKRPTNSEFGAK